MKLVCPILKQTGHGVFFYVYVPMQLWCVYLFVDMDVLNLRSMCQCEYDIISDIYKSLENIQ